jgi:hypothetical protein
MKKTTFSLLIFSVALLLSSCEGETTWIKQIDNQSNHLVTVTYTDGLAGGTVTKAVDPHTSEVIFYGEKKGGDETPVPCLEYLSDLVVTLDSGVVLVRDINSEDNWDYSASEKTLGSVVNQTCRFVVVNADFEQ